ncbi:cold-shock protein [Grimontia sp. AD028]|uniref:Ribosome-associated inhibitor A n=5 Tax=Grimontia TaxID=246861 RepID=A0A128EWI6_9GAMM|nr:MULTISPECIES: ribosome-associated translation inhibitor RaiA [Grimontia]EOD78715.1 Ribosome hibernation protein YfiA [Grimontia indica]KKD58093.1 cold-shock protein [Grimontia sp. AD028]NGO00343.1 ribosome-associated translation inhibitor RaiA [Grimontia sedimenti]USH02988.1 ribosome-associated translation inhibitor RaiA [Grimontia kaedaensis]WRV97246.1 ribosome-associated translation inhibitor RaiA [Grimontia sp. NTOU-MAR1]
MRVEITGKNIDITPAIRDRITSRFEKLEKWQVALINPHAVISEEPGNKFKVEAGVSMPGAKLIASAEHEDMYAAINEVGQKLEKQLNKQAHKGEARRASHAGVEVPEEESEAI